MNNKYGLHHHQQISGFIENMRKLTTDEFNSRFPMQKIFKRNHAYKRIRQLTGDGSPYHLDYANAIGDARPVLDRFILDRAPHVHESYVICLMGTVRALVVQHLVDKADYEQQTLFFQSLIPERE